MITGGTSQGQVTEDETLTATGTLAANDIDNGANLTWSIQGSSTGTYGSIGIGTSTGQWTYTLNNNALNVQALNTGQQVTDAFTARVSDGKGGFADQTITVTVKTITFDWQFITREDSSNNQIDTSLYSFGNQVFKLADAASPTGSNIRSNGWQLGTTTITVPTNGTYNFGFAIVNVGNNDGSNSILDIDNVRITGP